MEAASLIKGQLTWYKGILSLAGYRSTEYRYQAAPVSNTGAACSTGGRQGPLASPVSIISNTTVL